MSNLDIFGPPSSSRPPTSPRGKRKNEKQPSRVRGFLITVLVLAVMLGGIAVALPKVMKHFQGAPDFAGPGTDTVQVEVTSGETLAQIGNNLKAQGVVASVDSFTRAATENPDSSSIQPGFYTLKLQMKSSDAIKALLDPVSRIVKKVVIPEGKRVEWVLNALAQGTGIPRSDFDAVVANPTALGLPAYAQGKVEGFLFPATYDFPPNATAELVLKTMVDKFNSEIATLDIQAKSQTLGMSPYDIITIASLLQVEGHPRDFDKVSRVVYNRLTEPMRLQFDSTVNYGLGKTDVILTTDLLNKDTPYNTYLHDGLPPTPIDNPGIDAIKAALNPATGNWLYFTTTDLATQETKFTNSYSEFLKFKNEFLAYCKANPGSC